MHRKPRIIFFAYAFPPYNYPGSHRLRFFVKHLTELGWECGVVTIKDSYAGQRDPSLTAELPADIQICRTATFDLYEFQDRFQQAKTMHGQQSPVPGKKRWWFLWFANAYRFINRFFFFPDEQMCWRWIAYPQTSRFINDFKPDILFSSSLPYTSHLLAMRLAKNFKIPLVVDFRDEWSKNTHRVPITPLHRWLVEHMERQVLEYAKMVLSATDVMTQQFIDLAPKSRATFATIYNGYDDHPRTCSHNPPTKEFRIVFTGNFYGHRKPDSFFRAVLRAIHSGLIKKDDLKILFAGTSGFPSGEYSSDDLRMLDSITEFHGFVAQKEALRLQDSATLLLMVQDATGHSLKLFEYLQSGRPILALTSPEGKAAELLRAAGNPFIVPADDESGIEHTLARAYDLWKQHGRIPVSFSQTVISRYSRRNQSARLDSLLRALLDPTIV